MKKLVWILVALFVAGCGSTVTTTSTVRSPTTSDIAPPTSTPTTTVAPSVDELGPPTGPVIDHAVDPACGTELWAKKTLTDSGASGVDITPVQISTVDQLNAVSDSGAQGQQRVGIELHTYSFTGKLVEAKLEADSDYHVVMQDSAGKTLVTEYPAAQCVQDAAPAARQEIDAARQAFEQACGPIRASAFKQLNGQATVTGVGFYDRDHGQSGRDSLGDGNDVELHPAIGFTGSCPHAGLGRAKGRD